MSENNKTSVFICSKQLFSFSINLLITDLFNPLIYKTGEKFEKRLQTSERKERRSKLSGYKNRCDVVDKSISGLIIRTVIGPF